MHKSEGVHRIVTVIEIAGKVQFVIFCLIGLYTMFTSHYAASDGVFPIVFGIVILAVLMGVAWVIKGFNATQKQG